MNKKILLLAALAAIAPLIARAESNSTTGAGSLSATASLRFGITIPKVLFLQIGTGTSYTANPTVDNINFVVPASSVGNGTVLAGTGGDLFLSSIVTVRLLGNSGDILLNSTTTGALSSGVASNPTVPWSDILVTTSALPNATFGFINGAIAHPAFSTGPVGGPGTPVTVAATGGRVRREGLWFYRYANSQAVPAGTYGGSAAKNGLVVYSATVP
ncbi:hypothetical protein H6CHR_00666 [Variovorax sp. PBL-H6]|uniref:hypothetical protein n=1 Tax=Variovorax sp. PBL-H6 TaxID=434009 RepID=UPI001318A88F|nr:hypothetical protein [Variovorax sp. PBL-H6]VTU17007.1 hypothetical protein H6CHR_00666 [Variovorax sp. PBL-H6]